VVGWHFVYKHMEMIEKYVMLDAPPSPVFQKLVSGSWTQFKMSWYIFFYQMPKLPEFAVRMFDLKLLEVIKSKSGKTTNEDLEAFKYTFTKKSRFYFSFILPHQYTEVFFFSFYRRFDVPYQLLSGELQLYKTQALQTY
jgi:hypothetical protein